MLARRVLDEPVLLFRGTQGAADALIDRCPHHFAPLSRGRGDGGNIVCGYHGFVFDGRGACVHDPHGVALKSLAVRSLLLRDAHRALWIWMGDREQGQSGAPPDLAFIDDAPDTAFSKGYVRARAHYQLFVDNILDLTHADFLHPDTLGGGAFTRARARVIVRGTSIGVHWLNPDELPSPLMASVRGSDGRVDSWTEVDWYPASVLALRSGAVQAGTSCEMSGNVSNLHILTPETATTTHYFYAHTRDFAVDDDALNERIAATRDQIFATEDKPMVEAQQERMEGSSFGSLGPVLLRIDEGIVRVHRRLKR